MLTLPLLQLRRTPQKSRRATRCTALLLGLLLGLPVCPAARADGPAVGTRAPDLVLHTLDGRSLRTADLRGKVVILSFFATWCAPCQAELPALSRYAAAHQAQGLQVLGFSLDDAHDLPVLQQLAAGLSFPVGLLGSAWAGGYGRIWKLPASFTIDRNGRIADNRWDADDPVWTEQSLEAVITPLLQSAPPSLPVALTPAQPPPVMRGG